MIGIVKIAAGRDTGVRAGPGTTVLVMLRGD